MFPAGLYFCFKKMTDESIFAILYGITSIYFAGSFLPLKEKNTTQHFV
jgi:dolichyl-diphosphooligosaccharide--protein glycosyltransferase